MSDCKFFTCRKNYRHYSFGDTLDITYYCTKRGKSVSLNTCENCMKEIALEVLNKE